MILSTVAAILLQRGQLGAVILETIMFALIGIVLFAIAFGLIVKLSPFSIRKELEQDHNISIAVVIGAVIIGLAIIVASAIHG
jgi:putative membrane protein